MLENNNLDSWDHNSARDVVYSNHGINYPNQTWITMQMTYVWHHGTYVVSNRHHFKILA